MGLPINPPESLRYENGIADRISGRPSLGKRDCRSILRYLFVRKMGLPIDLPESLRYENGIADQSFGIPSSGRVGAYGIRPTNIHK